MKTEIIYEDTHLFVVRKPAGLATQTSKSTEPDMVSELKKYTKGGYIGLIHRLDQPVEGLLVVARNPVCAGSLNRQLQSANLGKEYLAVLCGVPSQQSGQLQHFLKKNQNNRAEVTTASDKLGKEALLEYQVLTTTGLPKPILAEGDSLPDGNTNTDGVVLEKGPLLSLVSVKIKTGRFHQIRAQFSAIGTPLLGDLKYGTTDSIALSNQLNIKQVALCANTIHFTHPSSKKELHYESKPQNPAFSLFGEQA